jgi:hypothetical protein
VYNSGNPTLDLARAGPRNATIGATPQVLLGLHDLSVALREFSTSLETDRDHAAHRGIAVRRDMFRMDWPRRVQIQV